MKNNGWKYEAARILRDFGLTNKQILNFIRKATVNHPQGKPEILYNATLRLAYANL